MKVLISIVIGLLVMGCGEEEAPKPQAKVPTTPKVEVKKSEPTKVVPEKLINDHIVEKAIREYLKKPTGELTKPDLEKVRTLTARDKNLTDVKGLEKLTQLRKLDLVFNKLTDVKGLEKLTKLTNLHLGNNLALTKAQIAELQKALPKCKIYSNPTK